ncbi:hypothetical protein [Candidatus Leptofilum sp.]|uniref:hypothetical protein n=1 Tax=Candidatus Leptofilum sp. TaxID=3241576 RepID=UPI003B5CE63D
MKKLSLISIGLGLIAIWLFWPKTRQFQARSLLDQAVEQNLPKVNDSEVVGILPEEFGSPVGRTCFYARDYFVLGFSSLSTEAAMEEYEKQLRMLEWQKRGSVYIYGANLKLEVIAFDVPVINYHKIVDYEELRNTYKGVLTIRLDYVLPDRATCNQ